MSQAVANKILSRVYGTGRGTVFTSADFLDLGSRAAVDQALSRLTKRGVLQRLGRGLYHYPKSSPTLGPLSPSPEEIAGAVARKRGIRLQPSGARAANALGLSTQVPARSVYLTDAPSGTIRLGRQTLVLKHAAPRRMAGAGTTPAAVIEALRHLGPHGVTKAVISRLSHTLADADKQQLARLRLKAPTWMQPALTEIAGEAPPTRRNAKRTPR